MKDKALRIGECVRWLWTASRGYRVRIACRGAVGVLNVGLSLASIWLSKCLIDRATGHTPGALGGPVVVMLACLAAQLLLSAANARLGGRMEVAFRNGLRHRLFTRLMAGRWNGREAFHSGDVMNRLTGDVLEVTDVLCRTVPAVMVTAVRLGGAFGILYMLDVRLAVATLLIMPIALLFSKRYMRAMRRLTNEIREQDSRVQSHLQEHWQQRVLVRVMEYTPRALEALTGLQHDLEAHVVRRTDFSTFSRLMVQTGFAAGYVTAFLWGVYGLRAGTVTFGMMTAFLQLVAQIQGPMVEFSRQVPVFVQAFASVERIHALASLPPEEQGSPVRLDGVAGVRMTGVSFAYPDGHRVMQGFTHDFAPGSLTAVVGETGAGKSTLLRLVQALLLPDEGSVTLYNRHESRTASPLTRCNLSYVPQGNTLVSGTVRHNLLMGNPAATDRELREALHTAAADFVLASPEGLDTPCGEQGTGFSEGQAQRIAIARGLLRPGSILLLDEPTSSLDKETEQVLLQRLLGQVRNKTLILVTHREAVAGLCTEIIHIKRT